MPDLIHGIEPEKVAANEASWTGRYLKELLARHAQRRRAARRKRA